MQPTPETSGADAHRWLGPSYALAVSDGSRAMCVLSGYRKELATWEGRVPSAGRRRLTWRTYEAVAFGATSLVGKTVTAWTSFELDVILDDMPADELTELVRYCGGPIVADGINNLPKVGSVPISANRDLEVPKTWKDAGITAVDLRVSTMPTRRRKRNSEVIYGSRWVRIIVMPNGFIAMWYPVEGNWPVDQVRWPHFCIPSRSPSWISTYAISPDLTGSERLHGYLSDFVTHEEYFLNSWGLELELWEETLYAQLVDVDSEVFGRLRFPELQRELGHLADYITRLRFDQRNLSRRTDESRALSGQRVNDLLVHHSEMLGDEINQSRALLRHAFSLMSSAATGEQFFITRKQQQVTERFQNTITFVTAVLLVPTLIAGVYGSNIRELSPSSRGTLPELLGAMAIGAVTSAGILRWRQGHPLVGQTRRHNAIVLLIGLAVAISGVTLIAARGYSTAMIEFIASGLVIAAYSVARGFIKTEIEGEDGD